MKFVVIVYDWTQYNKEYDSNLDIDWIRNIYEIICKGRRS